MRMWDLSKSIGMASLAPSRATMSHLPNTITIGMANDVISPGLGPFHLLLTHKRQPPEVAVHNDFSFSAARPMKNLSIRTAEKSRRTVGRAKQYHPPPTPQKPSSRVDTTPYQSAPNPQYPL